MNQPSPTSSSEAQTKSKDYHECEQLAATLLAKMDELSDEERVQLAQQLIQDQPTPRAKLRLALIEESDASSNLIPFTFEQALNRVKQAREQLENNRQASVLPIFQQLLDEFHQRIPKGFKTKEETQRVVKAVNQLTDEYGVQLELDGVKVKPRAESRGSISARRSSANQSREGRQQVGYPKLSVNGKEPDPRYYKPSEE